MSLQVPFFLPTTKFTPNSSIIKRETNAEFDRSLATTPLPFLLIELSTPIIGLIITKVFYLSIPWRVLVFATSLTTMVTLATSPHVLPLLHSIPTKGSKKRNPASTYHRQELFRRITPIVTISVMAAALGRACSLPLFFTEQTFTPLLVSLLGLLVIASTHPIAHNARKALKESPILQQDGNHCFWMHNLIALFGATVTSFVWGASLPAAYLQISACAVLTILCKDTRAEIDDFSMLFTHFEISKIKTLIHKTLCLSTIGYQLYSVYTQPILLNMAYTLLMTIHVLFVLYIDPKQEAKSRDNALSIVLLNQALPETAFQPTTGRGYSTFEGTQQAPDQPSTVFIMEDNPGDDQQHHFWTVPKTKIRHDFKRFKKAIQQHSRSQVSWWYFAMKILHQVLLGAGLFYSPVPVQPAEWPLRAFLLSQIISKTTGCILQGVESILIKRTWREAWEKEICSRFFLFDAIDKKTSKLHINYLLQP